jgi:hypothetical protein
MEMMSCAACGAPLTAKNLDRRLGIATCGQCGAMYDLSKGDRPKIDEPEDLFALAEAPRDRALPVPQPPELDVTRNLEGFEASWRWFGAQHVFLLFFAILWNGFLVVWYSIALGIFFQEGLRGDAFMMLVFPLLHVAAGIGVGYAAITGLVNRTTFTVRRGGQITVRHGPIPYWSSPTMRASDVDQLYVTRNVTRSKNGSTTTFALHALGRDGIDNVLVKGMQSAVQARWLERETEDVLAIADRPVEGEHGT